MLIKKAVVVRKHLERNKKDKDSKFRLILIESRIHRFIFLKHNTTQLNFHFRLARYYRSSRKLDANWKYESATASALVA
jgi:small subunit ribosomal protein S13e